MRAASVSSLSRECELDEEDRVLDPGLAISCDRDVLDCKLSAALLEAILRALAGLLTGMVAEGGKSGGPLCGRGTAAASSVNLKF